MNFREMKELRWRSRGPPLPDTVLDAVTLKINSPLPQAYRNFLSKMDGGRLVNVLVRSSGKEWQIEGLYPVAEATDRGLKLQRSGKCPEGFIPIAFTPDKGSAENKGPPLVFLEVVPGKIYLRTSPRAKFDDSSSVYPIAKDFAAFLALLGSGETAEIEAMGGKKKKKAPAKSSNGGQTKASSGAKKTATKKTATKKTATKKKATKKKATKKKARRR